MQQLLDQPVYTIWVSDNASQPITGELTFGSINPKYFYGTLARLPINSQVTFTSLHFFLPAQARPDKYE